MNTSVTKFYLYLLSTFLLLVSCPSRGCNFFSFPMLFIGYICAVPYLIGITRRLNSNRKSSFCLQDTLALLLMTPTKHVKDFRIWELSLLRNQRMVTFFNFILEIQFDYTMNISFLFINAMDALCVRSVILQ